MYVYYTYNITKYRLMRALRRNMIFDFHIPGWWRRRWQHEGARYRFLCGGGCSWSRRWCQRATSQKRQWTDLAPRHLTTSETSMNLFNVSPLKFTVTFLFDTCWNLCLSFLPRVRLMGLTMLNALIYSTTPVEACKWYKHRYILILYIRQ